MGTIKIKKDGEWVKLPNYGIEEFPDAPSDGKHMVGKISNGQRL